MLIKFVNKTKNELAVNGSLQHSTQHIEGRVVPHMAILVRFEFVFEGI